MDRRRQQQHQQQQQPSQQEDDKQANCNSMSTNFNENTTTQIRNRRHPHFYNSERSEVQRTPTTTIGNTTTFTTRYRRRRISEQNTAAMATPASAFVQSETNNPFCFVDRAFNFPPLDDFFQEIDKSVAATTTVAPVSSKKRPKQQSNRNKRSIPTVHCTATKNVVDDQERKSTQHPPTIHNDTAASNASIAAKEETRIRHDHNNTNSNSSRKSDSKKKRSSTSGIVSAASSDTVDDGGDYGGESSSAVSSTNANLSIGARASLNEHLRYVAKYGLDRDEKMDDSNNTQLDNNNILYHHQGSSTSPNLLDVAWDKLLVERLNASWCNPNNISNLGDDDIVDDPSLSLGMNESTTSSSSSTATLVTTASGRLYKETESHKKTNENFLFDSEAIDVLSHARNRLSTNNIIPYSPVTSRYDENNNNISDDYFNSSKTFELRTPEKYISQHSAALPAVTVRRKNQKHHDDNKAIEFLECSGGGEASSGSYFDGSSSVVSGSSSIMMNLGISPELIRKLTKQGAFPPFILSDQIGGSTTTASDGDPNGSDQLHIQEVTNAVHHTTTENGCFEDQILSKAPTVANNIIDSHNNNNNENFFFAMWNDINNLDLSRISADGSNADMVMAQQSPEGSFLGLIDQQQKQTKSPPTTTYHEHQQQQQQPASSNNAGNIISSMTEEHFRVPHIVDEINRRHDILDSSQSMNNSGFADDPTLVLLLSSSSSSNDSFLKSMFPNERKEMKQKHQQKQSPNLPTPKNTNVSQTQTGPKAEFLPVTGVSHNINNDDCAPNHRLRMEPSSTSMSSTTPRTTAVVTLMEHRSKIVSRYDDTIAKTQSPISKRAAEIAAQFLMQQNSSPKLEQKTKLSYTTPFLYRASSFDVHHVGNEINTIDQQIVQNENDSFDSFVNHRWLDSKVANTETSRHDRSLRQFELSNIANNTNKHDEIKYHDDEDRSNYSNTTPDVSSSGNVNITGLKSLELSPIPQTTDFIDSLSNHNMMHRTFLWTSSSSSTTSSKALMCDPIIPRSSGLAGISHNNGNMEQSSMKADNNSVSSVSQECSVNLDNYHNETRNELLFPNPDHILVQPSKNDWVGFDIRTYPTMKKYNKDYYYSRDESLYTVPISTGITLNDRRQFRTVVPPRVFLPDSNTFFPPEHDSFSVQSSKYVLNES